MKPSRVGAGAATGLTMLFEQPAASRTIQRIWENSAWRTCLIQLALIETAVLAAFFLRFEFMIPGSMRPALLWAAVSWALVKIPVNHCFGLHRYLWRYFSTPDLRRLAVSGLAGSAVVGALTAAVFPYSFPRSVIAIDFLFTVLFTASAGAVARMVSEPGPTPGLRTRPRALIFGAGAAGVLLLRESRMNARFSHTICGFIDDDEKKRHRVIQGVPVLGTGDDLREIAQRWKAQEVLIAVPSAQGPQMRRIVELCQSAGVTYRTMPAICEIISDRGLGRQLRDVAVEDLLGRRAVQLDRRQIERKLANRVVLVTGAAGSIGSELCRQIALCRPAALIALDISETGLFHIERELRQAFPELVLHSEIASIRSRERLDQIFSLHRPQVVYHAAAYKHVPMMEANAFEAVENNVIGTWNLSGAAREHGAKDLVMISSDKAVRPTSVMGVTKRISELIVRSLESPGSRHVSVRFGNVLGSNGSVVPIFKSQIAAGGPVTVTHPDMSRYFMTIPEAVQLVMQASAMGRGGEIFVLDMGSPVSIVELARQLIRLSGYKPGEDIQIEFTGPRPGEKLHEELNLDEEAIQPTHHAKIKVFSGVSIQPGCMTEHFLALRTACADGDLGALVAGMRKLVPDYTVSEVLQAQIRSLQQRPAFRRTVATAEPIEGTMAGLDRLNIALQFHDGLLSTKLENPDHVEA
jgi:FlaA1/EpsC-like NDP-sugar epimerase